MKFDHIKEVLSETQEFDYRPEDWLEVEKELHPRKKRRFFFWWFFGALVIAGLWLGINRSNNSPENKISEAKITEQTLPVKINDQIIKSETTDGIENTPNSSPNKTLSHNKRAKHRNYLPPRKADENNFSPEDAVADYGYKSDTGNSDQYNEAPSYVDIAKEKQSVAATQPVPCLELYVSRSVSDSLPHKPNFENVPQPSSKPKTPRKHVRLGLGLTMPLANDVALDGISRTPRALGQEYQLGFYPVDRILLEASLKKQKSFSFHDSLDVLKANQWYPDYSGSLALAYDTFDVEQVSLTLDLSAFVKVVDKERMRVFVGGGARFNLGRNQSVFTVVDNPYAGVVRETHDLEYNERFKGITPKVFVDFPLWKGIGVSLGAEYLFLSKKVELDLGSKLSAFGKLYFEF